MEDSKQTIYTAHIVCNSFVPNHSNLFTNMNEKLLFRCHQTLLNLESKLKRRKSTSREYLQTTAFPLHGCHKGVVRLSMNVKSNFCQE